uniref:Carbohydrate sulfotransferase n=1 Tax=Acrobeloides nanus TaxID=290746 RepID=A0A914DEA9_9BILA
MLSTKYRLNLCAIEKNFSTILTAIICFLFDEDKFRKKNREFGKETFARRLCARQNEAFSFDHISTKYNISEADLNNWVHFAAIREPIDRFVSGFVDKCLVERTWIQYKERCNGCMTNLTCFVDAEYDRMLRFSKEKARLNSFDDRHFFPQNW